MAVPERCLAILDAGHGNSAVVSVPEGVIVIDAGPGNVLQGFLAQQGLTTIDCVLLSHSDEDHIAGLLGLLSDNRFRVKKVRVNSDALKGSKIWDDLLFELEQRESKGIVDFEPALTAGQNGQFDLGATKVEILGPGALLAGKGPGSSVDGKYLGGGAARSMTTNSISAVIRITNDSKRVALLTGDVDDIGLDNMVSRKVDGCAPLVVFPHHGGRPGKADAVDFTKRLWSFTRPGRVIFSIGRNKHENPRPEIVQALRACDPGVHVSCTQLSRHCADTAPANPGSHLHEAFARGRVDRSCCLGTTVLNLETCETQPSLKAHKEFVLASAPKALCQK